MCQTGRSWRRTLRGPNLPSSRRSWLMTTWGAKGSWELSLRPYKHRKPHLGLKCLIFAVSSFFCWSNACNFMHLYAIFIFATKRHQVSKRAETAISWDKHPQTCGATCGLAVCKVCALAGVLDPQTPHFVYFVQWGGLFYMDGVLNTVVYTL